MSGRATFVLVIGVIMVALGAYIALRLLWMGGAPLTATRWLDFVFGAFFVFRGALNIRSARRMQAMAADRPPTPSP